MITLKSYATAFLERDGKFLLLHRAENRAFNPSVWSGVGGKLEAEERNDPHAACLREIYEESGISAEEISGLTLRYIILRRRGDGISQNYIYFGKSLTQRFVDSDEGTLHWIPREQLLTRTYTPTYARMMEHFLSAEADEGKIFGAFAESQNGLQMDWKILEDFE